MNSKINAILKGATLGVVTAFVAMFVPYVIYQHNMDIASEIIESKNARIERLEEELVNSRIQENILSNWVSENAGYVAAGYREIHKESWIDNAKDSTKNAYTKSKNTLGNWYESMKDWFKSDESETFAYPEDDATFKKIRTIFLEELDKIGVQITEAQVDAGAYGMYSNMLTAERLTGEKLNDEEIREAIAQGVSVGNQLQQFLAAGASADEALDALMGKW